MPLHILHREPKAHQNPLDLRLHPEGVQILQLVLQFTEDLERVGVLRTLRIEAGKRLLRLLQFLLDRHDVFKGCFHLFIEGPSGSGDAILREIADGDVRRLADPPLIRASRPDHDPKKGRFSRPVRPDKPDPVMGTDQQRDIFEQYATAVLECYVFEREHGSDGRKLDTDDRRQITDGRRQITDNDRPGCSFRECEYTKS